MHRQPGSTWSKWSAANETVLKGGDWEEYKSIFRAEVKVSETAFDRIREAFERQKS